METYQEQLLPKAAHILKMFYDSDILEEEAILEWADKVWYSMTGTKNATNTPVMD